MSFLIGTLAVALFIGIGAWHLIRKAHQQNHPLIRELRSGNRGLRTILWDSLVVWSPMILVIVLLLGMASLISRGLVELAYRYSTLDEFCEVQGLGRPLVIACTDLDNELDATKITQISPRIDIERQLFRRYSETRHRLLNSPALQLHEQAKNPTTFNKGFSAAIVLGLPPAVEDDPTLMELIAQERRLRQSPIPVPMDIVQIMSYSRSVESRNRMLMDLRAKIAARRKVLYVNDYRQLPPDQKKQYVQKTRLLFQLRQLDVKIDPAVLVMLAGPAEKSDGVQSNFIRKALVRALANEERRVRSVIFRALESPEKAAMVFGSLGMQPECTVAAENSTLRLKSDDFDSGFVEQGALPADNAGSFPCLSKSDVGKTLKLASVGFRKSVLLSIDRLREETAFNAFRQIENLEQDVAVGAVETKSAARVLGNTVPSVIPLGRQECNLFHPVNCVMNGIADSSEAAYTRSRNKLISQYEQETGMKVDTTAMTIQEKIDHARITTDAGVARMHAAAYETAESLFSFNNMLRLLGWIALIFIASKSFLYVLALEIFDRERESKISFDAGNKVVGNIVSGSEVIIDRNYHIPIINRGSLTNTLVDIEIAPWRWSAPITRILQGRYFLFNRSVFSPPVQISGSDEVKGMEASARSGFSIVEWQMQPGEEVVFHYKDFYGASANVQLKTEFSLRLSTLLLGKVFFHYARCTEGEGRLLLEARVHNTTQGGMSSIKPERLVAWNRHAQFSAGSHHHPWKTFINPFTIVRESAAGAAKALVIIAPESEASNVFGMGLRSIKRIFLRIF